MQLVLGWVMIIFGTALYLAQLVSSLNFPLAQRLGIQEDPASSDTLLQRAERYTAYWDLVTLGWLPLAGVLMVTNHPWWPLMSLLGGAIYFDTAGREAAKNLSLQNEGVRVGAERERKLFFASYLLMAALALLVIYYSLHALIDRL